jgi:hypothetical protein
MIAAGVFLSTLNRKDDIGGERFSLPAWILAAMVVAVFWPVLYSVHLTYKLYD